MKRSLGLSALLLLALSPRGARADFTGEFADALTVDAEYATGVTGATDIAFAPDGRAVITQRSGAVTVRLPDGTKVAQPDVFDVVYVTGGLNSEQGLLGVVADPTTPNAFFFYGSMEDGGEDNRQQVHKAMLNEDNTLTVDPNPVVAQGRNTGDPGLEGPANHNGGALFIYDNHLYMGVGDTGANATPATNKYSSCLNKGNGKILRVNLDGTIPDDNPLVNVAQVTTCDSVTGAWATGAPDKRIYAWGFRNPWRLWVDSETGRMWIGDVGESTREEISVSGPAEGYMGEHFGYPFREGTTNHRASSELSGKNDCMDIEPARDCVAPATDYATGTTNGRSITGGLIPEGCGWGAAFGGTTYYFYGDYTSHRIRALAVNETRSGGMGEPEETGTLGNGPVALRQGPGGGMYVVLYQANAVVEVKPTNQTGDDCQSMGGAGGAGGMAGAAGGGSGGVAGDGTGGTGGANTAGQTMGGSGGSTAGSGPSGGGGQSAGMAGSTASGGSSVSGSGGSANPAGGSGGTGGASAAGRGGTTTAGSTSTAGQSGSGTAGTPAGEPPEESGGCGCRVAGERSGSLAGLIATLGVAGFIARRRRRR
jgi:MYXO-CTERM domain-containing protein